MKGIAEQRGAATGLNPEGQIPQTLYKKITSYVPSYKDMQDYRRYVLSPFLASKERHKLTMAIAANSLLPLMSSYISTFFTSGNLKSALNSLPVDYIPFVGEYIKDITISGGEHAENYISIVSNLATFAGSYLTKEDLKQSMQNHVMDDVLDEYLSEENKNVMANSHLLEKTNQLGQKQERANVPVFAGKKVEALTGASVEATIETLSSIASIIASLRTVYCAAGPTPAGLLAVSSLALLTYQLARSSSTIKNKKEIRKLDIQVMRSLNDIADSSLEIAVKGNQVAERDKLRQILDEIRGNKEEVKLDSMNSNLALKMLMFAIPALVIPHATDPSKAIIVAGSVNLILMKVKSLFGSINMMPQAIDALHELVGIKKDFNEIKRVMLDDSVVKVSKSNTLSPGQIHLKGFGYTLPMRQYPPFVNNIRDKIRYAWGEFQSVLYPSEGPSKGKPKPRLLDTDILIGKEGPETLHLVGPSGTGKTQFIKALFGLNPLARGTVEFGCQLNQVTMHVQNATLPKQTTLKQLLSPTGYECHLDLEKAKEYLVDLRLFDKLSALLDNNQVVDDWKRELSGGERARLALIPTLLKGGEVVFLDEPVDSLGAVDKALMYKAIDNAFKDKTVIVVDHAYLTQDVVDKEFEMMQDKNLYSNECPQLPDRFDHDKMKCLVINSQLQKLQIKNPRDLAQESIGERNVKKHKRINYEDNNIEKVNSI